MDAMNEPAPQTRGRLHAVATSKPILFVLAALLVYALAGFLLAPWLVRQQLPALVEKHLGGQGSVAEVRINPFLLTFEAADLAIAEKNGNPAVRVGRLFVDLEAISLLRWTWTFREIRIERPLINAELDAQENLNLARLLPPEPGTDGEAGSAPGLTAMPRLLLQHLVIDGGAFSFNDQTLRPAARAQFNPFSFEMHDVSTLPDHSGNHALKARLPGGGNLQWEGKLSLAPLDSSGSITLQDAKLATLWQFMRDRLAVAEPGGSYGLALRYRMRYGNGALELNADDLAFRMNNISLTRAGDGATLGKLDAIAFEGGRFDLRQRSLAFSDVRLADAAINVILDEDGKPDWGKLWIAPPAKGGTAADQHAAPPPDPAPASTPWQITLPKIGIGPLALTLTDRSRVRPLHLTFTGAQADFGLTATVGGKTQFVVDNGNLKLGDTRLRSGDDREPLLTLAAAQIDSLAFDMQNKSASAGLLRLSGGRTRVDRAADGSLNLAGAFAARRDQTAADRGFSVTLDRAELTGHELAMTDRSFRPAITYDLQQIRFALTKIAVPFKGPSPLELTLRVRQGGTLKAGGRIDLQQQSADLRFEAADVALTPLQPLLRRDTTLVLASGKAGAAGRLTWNGKKNPLALRYSGTATVTDLDLKVEGTGERLLGWQRLAAGGINFDSVDNRLAIAQIRIARPYSKLVINKDRTTNLGSIMRKRTAPAAPAAQDKTGAMAISLDRINVELGELDFSDLSLVLPFSTNIKALGGSANGLSSAPESRASLKFEGRIEDSGLARAEGTIQPFAPKRFTDIAVTFRNVALTPLSPYSATFAGRKIASGKLSLDLQYKLDNSQLAGDNKVLLEQFTLGERVESPTAVNLPLDLAIALLSDSEGRIDLAVPVTGNVDNPEFSYGHLIWQAIRTVITRIVAAPFRALGALFGSSTDSSAGDIVFDPGSARILPTEYEKLRRVAEGLQKRPQLKLVVQGLFHKDSDSKALRTQAVRADLAVREGLKLAPDEDPGPAAFDNAKTQRALETMLNERAGSDAAAQFADSFRKSAGREASRVNAVLALMGRGAGDRALYEALYQRLIELQPLPDTALTELAKNRSDRIIGAFTKRLKFDPARLGSKPAEAADETVKNGVPVKLSFEPIKPWTEKSEVVAGDGIEPPTQGFSVLCSTN